MPTTEFRRMPEDTYSIDEVKQASKAWEGRLAADTIRSVLDRMEQAGIEQVPKKSLSESEWELLDIGLISSEEAGT